MCRCSFAWYSATKATANVSANSVYGTIASTESSVSLDDIVIKFNVAASPATAVKLHDGAGKTKAWAADGVTLLERSIVDGDVASGYVRSMVITITGVYAEDDTEEETNINTSAALAEYVGTYTFYLRVGGQGRLAGSAVTTVAGLNAMAATAQPFTVTIAEGTGDKEGKYTAGVDAHNICASVVGSDDVGPNAEAAAREKATFTINLTASD